MNLGEILKWVFLGVAVLFILIIMIIILLSKIGIISIIFSVIVIISLLGYKVIELLQKKGILK